MLFSNYLPSDETLGYGAERPFRTPFSVVRSLTVLFVGRSKSPRKKALTRVRYKTKRKPLCLKKNK
jgi:hypothetical protein